MLFGAAIAAATLYLALLFWIAARQDRLASRGRAMPAQKRDWIYGLSLAVYCTCSAARRSGVSDKTF
tara:strand:+ start:280 stop:480 length:201 start_codon:yes stop_codon:yes gene_type:complete